jgi:hypothetical protein
MLRIREAAIALSIVVPLLGGCGTHEPWTKTAGETTCADWIDTMTPEQRAGLGGALLAVLWDQDGAASRPGDAVIARFADAIGGACGSFRAEKISTIGSGLYSLSDDVKPGSQ